MYIFLHEELDALCSALYFALQKNSKRHKGK